MGFRRVCDGCGTACEDGQVTPVGALDPIDLCADCLPHFEAFQAADAAARQAARKAYAADRASARAEALTKLAALPDE